MMHDGLFPPTAEEIAERVDREIRDLLLGHHGGPLGLLMEAPEKDVLRCLRGHAGVAKAIRLRDVCEATKLDVRNVKSIVRGLRMKFRLPIGSSKNGAEGGYFLMVTDADRAVWAKDVLDQVRAEVSVLRSAAGQKVALELAGQIRNDLMEVEP